MNTSIETGTALEMVIYEFAFAHALLIVLGIQHLQKKMYRYRHLTADAESHIQETRLGCSVHKPGTTQCCNCPNAGTSCMCSDLSTTNREKHWSCSGSFFCSHGPESAPRLSSAFVLSASSDGPTNVATRISSQGLEHDAVQGKLDHNHFII